MNDYNIIKQVGKGTFSTVHLCKRKKSSILLLSGILLGGGMYDDEPEEDDYFIIKEINMGNLVRKYVKKSNINVFKTQKISKTTSVSITPYANTNTKLTEIIQKLDSEEQYYYKRLRDLIDSEIEVLQKLEHKNIIKYFSSEMSNDIYNIKMEYCQYGDLYSILKNQTDNAFKLRNTYGGFDTSFVNKYLHDTIDGLFYLHDLNIIHRDIKLHNILVKREKNQFIFKLSDFGFACFDLDCKLNDDLGTSDFDFSVSELKKKYYKLCGTPYYMAPEIILNVEEFEQLTSEISELNKKHVKFYDKKVDLWSYGICLYELIFNVLPFSNNQIYDICDLKSYFSNATTQLNINKNIDKKYNISNRIKDILKHLLIINPSFRIDTEELLTMIDTIGITGTTDIIDISDIADIADIINSDENAFVANELENLKNNVIKEPINLKTNVDVDVDLNSWIIEDDHGHDDNDQIEPKKRFPSWDRINKASSMLMKISVDNNFMKWLINKK